MAPEPDVPVIQLVKFRANDRCLSDPSLFQAVREKAQGWHEKGLEAQYWGTSELAKYANEFFWLLFWQSYVHATAIEADPSYPAFIQDRDALVTELVFEVHATFSGDPPRRPLEAPITVVIYYKMNPNARPAAETFKMIQGIPPLMKSVQGFIASSAGISVEDGIWGVTLRGWRSAEEHMRLGTIDEHKDIIDLMEDIMKGGALTELFVAHVQFKLHTVQSSA